MINGLYRLFCHSEGIFLTHFVIPKESLVPRFVIPKESFVLRFVIPKGPFKTIKDSFGMTKTKKYFVGNG
jgi:hypothetical protein